jgi:molybdopterin/thiamine biosynthesis adenylyltransferase
MDDTLVERYSKQVLLQEIGGEGQRRLNGSSVLLVGCGGLGTVIANSLARAGVGRIRIIDPDCIELDNLQRQILFDESDIKRGLPKASAAAEKLRLINSTITIEPVIEKLTADNVEKVMRDVDLVLDGTDNFETRLLINEACVKYNRPWIYGGVVSTYGMSYTIIPGETLCFRCLVNELPRTCESPSCNTIGVLGTAVNIVASVEVTEALKILTGKKEALLRKLVYIDVWYGTWDLIELKKGRVNCPVCDDKKFDFFKNG